MHRPLTDLGCELPVMAAPMAGGPSTPALVREAAGVGALGFLAGGYKGPEALATEMAAVRTGGTERFGVNLFAPNPVPVDPTAFRSYAELLQVEGDRYGLDLVGARPVEDEDQWHDKLELLVSQPVPVVSFTFGVPQPSEIARLRRAGTLVAQTVTNAAEGQRAAEAGVDALIVQGWRAGGHSATLTPATSPLPVDLVDLIAQIRHLLSLPVVAAGGLSTAADVGAALRAGADATMVGTVLLRSPESGASATYKEALGRPDRGITIVTRAFSGRPARALVNAFVERYDAVAPLGYPAVHHLTSPLRRAAAAAGDAGAVNLWSGTGHRHAGTDPAGTVLNRLAGG